MRLSGMGSRSRHAERRAAASGSANGTGPRAAPREAEDTTTVGRGARSSGSDAAQHMATPNGVMAALELSTGGFDWCIGHDPTSERASRVAIQLAHRAAGSAESASIRMTAVRRLLRVPTLQECCQWGGAVNDSLSEPRTRCHPTGVLSGGRLQDKVSEPQPRSTAIMFRRSRRYTRVPTNAGGVHASSVSSWAFAAILNPCGDG